MSLSKITLTTRLISIILILLIATFPITGCDKSTNGTDTGDQNGGGSTDGDNSDNTDSPVDDTAVFDKKQAVLMLGQSNMAGRGELQYVEAISDSRITMLRGGSWVPMQEPIHDDKPTVAGACLGASFAKAFVEKFDCELGLIPAAFGGTTLADWKVGGEYYMRALNMADAALQDSEICAILWHQGEGDQRNSNYASELRIILNSFIKDLGLDTSKIIIITGELGEFMSESGRNNVNGALEELGRYYPNYAVASSAALTRQDDIGHFDAASLRVFGYRYFAHFYKMTTGKTFAFDDHPDSYRITPED